MRMHQLHTAKGEVEMTPSVVEDVRQTVHAAPTSPPHRNLVVPAYWYREHPERSDYVLAFWCPWCREIHKHVSSGALIEPRLCEWYEHPRCRFAGHGYHLLNMGLVRSLDDLPRPIDRRHAGQLIELLSK